MAAVKLLASLLITNNLYCTSICLNSIACFTMMNLSNVVCHYVGGTMSPH